MLCYRFLVINCAKVLINDNFIKDIKNSFSMTYRLGFLRVLCYNIHIERTPNNRGDGKNGNIKSHKSNGREKIQN